jgi:hypothetical protein
MGFYQDQIVPLLINLAMRPARIEYLYLDKGHIATGVIGPPATTITSRVQDNLVRAGLNYRFPIAR